jgi:hypothetical protein
MEGIGDTRKRLAGLLRELVDWRTRVAEPECVGAAGVEVVAGGRLLSDLAVLLLDFAAKLLDVNQLACVDHRFRNLRCSSSARALWSR